MSQLLEAARLHQPLPEVFIQARRPARPFEPIEGAALTRHWDDAEERILADVDTYSDWLYSKCIGTPAAHCRFGYIPRGKTDLMLFVESLDVAQLVAALLHPRSEFVALAAWQLRDLYLADPQTQAALQRASVEIQQEG